MKKISSLIIATMLAGAVYASAPNPDKSCCASDKKKTENCSKSTAKKTTKTCAKGEKAACCASNKEVKKSTSKADKKEVKS